MILSAFQVIENVLKMNNWKEEDLQVIRCIANDVAFPLTDVQGDIVEFFGSNPSGHALTVIINCIVNSLYMRYCFELLKPEGVELENFKEYVALMTYGDDNVMGVSPKAQWFNHSAIQKVLSNVGVVYTMADKETASVPYIDISDCSFLKRSFVIVDETRVACPLDWSSIEKMLTMCVVSKTICPEEQSMQTIRSAVGEFFQYGPKLYAQHVQKMKNIVADANLNMWVTEVTFPTYEHMLEMHYSACDQNDEMCSMFCERST
jgi:hypothetical protein